MEYERNVENKFVYTKAQSREDWAGAVMPENHEKSEVISDRPTDRPTDRHSEL